VQQQLVQQEAEGLRRLNLDREQVLARLWEIANLSPEMTRGSITGQVKALSMIVAMQNFIPDRRATSSEKKSPPATTTQPQIYAAAWRRGQEATTIDPQPSPGLAQEEDSPAVPACPACPGARRGACRGSPSSLPARRQRRLRIVAPASPPLPTALAPRKPRRWRLMSPYSLLFQTREWVSL
jgi:hypothetical protein